MGMDRNNLFNSRTLLKFQKKIICFSLFGTFSCTLFIAFPTKPCYDVVIIIITTVILLVNMYTTDFLPG